MNSSADKAVGYNPFNDAQRNLDHLPPARNFGGVRHGFNSSAHERDRPLDRMTAYPQHLVNDAIPLPPEFDGLRWNRSLYGEPSSENVKTGDADTDMMTVVPSRDQSVVAEPGDICQCDDRLSTNSTRSMAAGTSTQCGPSSSRLPSLSMILNSPRRSEGATMTARKFQFQMKPNTIPSHAISPSPHRRPSTARMSISTASDSTIRASFSIPEQRYFLLNTLHQICLDATTAYIRALPPSSGRRFPRSRTYSRRYHPYRDVSRERLYNHDNSRTLMDNIAVISTSLWKRARRDGMAPHRAESWAIKEMHNLYMWGECLVTGFEGGFTTESERNDYIKTAKKLCAWLRIEDDIELCQEVEDELKDIAKLEDEEEEGIIL